MLGFLAIAWVALLGILVADPDIYLRRLGATPPSSTAYAAAFFAALTGLIAFLGFGVARRWRWLFWVIVVAFLAGILRLPASALELADVVPREGPSWYLVLQAVIGVAQTAIAIMLLRGWRRSGPWGPF